MIVNNRVTKAGYNFIGHYRIGELKIIFEDVAMKISKEQIRDLYKFFKIFDIESEDGAYLQEIEGRYCRLEYDAEMYLARVGHITKDIWFDVVRA